MTPRAHLESEWRRWLVAIRSRENAKRRGWAPSVVRGWQKTIERHEKNIGTLVEIVIMENHAR